MRMELELRSAQTVSPQMITSMTILQYGAQELAEYLSELSYENPMLELQEPQREEPSDRAAERLRWLRQGDRQNQSYYAEESGQSIPIPASAARTLEGYLREQLMAMSIAPELRRAAEVIIALLDEHGFFPGDIAEAARLARCSEELAQEALGLIRRLDPAGAGAADVRECLLLQLDRMDRDTELPRRILMEQLRHVQSPARLAAALGQSQAAVDAALALLAGLNPYPADGFASQEDTIYVRPDLYIWEDQGRLTVQCSRDVLPQVHISGQYLKMLETERDPAVQKYLREKLRQVEQVLHDLSNRESTILRCGQVLAQRQREFFLGGSLRKLTLRDVAQELEVHESTVSRTIRGKYIQCARGLLPMRHFFSRSAGQNPALCRVNIQEALAQIIAGEDRAHPYSDQQLSRLLSAQHMVISRRTVAKYRAELGILPASARKRA